jgi:flagellar protein FliO/FliZ
LRKSDARNDNFRIPFNVPALAGSKSEALNEMDGTLELNLWSTGLKTMAMLFIVLGLLVLVLYFMKKFLMSRRGNQGNLFIKVLSSLHLSPKVRIEVVEILGEKIVLGLTPGHISFLTKVGGLTPSPLLSPSEQDDGGQERDEKGNS